jgi:hypothetical protein
MKKERTLFFIGLWVALLPYLGFPTSFRKILFVITGLVIIYFSYMLRKASKEEAQNLQKEDNSKMNTFVDNIGNTA